MHPNGHASGRNRPDARKCDPSVERLSGEVGAKNGADVMKTLVSFLADVTERLGEMEQAGHTPRIPTEAPNPPHETQRAVGEKGFKCHACQRTLPRESIGATQWKRGDTAGRKCKACCRNAARGVVPAKSFVRCEDVKPGECSGGTQW